MSLEELSSGDEASGSALEGTRGRGETKARKALSKLGLKKVEGINRVVIRRPKNVLLVISSPEVFKGNSDCYVVFGEGKIEDTTQANQFSQQQLAQAEAMERAAAQERQSSAVKSSEADDDDDEDVDEEGIDPADIAVVVGQVGCSRGKAVKALKKNNGDIVQAILDAN